MIARNFIQFPEALAMQLCLQFGAVLRWATGRPSTRRLRAIRADRARRAKALATVPPWFPPLCPVEKKPTPRWFAAKSRAARDLANAVRAAISSLLG